MEKKTVYLGLGTNTGNKQENMRRAIGSLSLALGSPIACSTFMESEPWGFESDNTFLNCVVAFSTSMPPLALLDTTEQIERSMGRTSKSINGQYSDRIIDIDILFYGNEIIDSKRLTVPHPLLHKRTFVLRPLHEIAPQLTHPAMGRTIDELLATPSRRPATGSSAMGSIKERPTRCKTPKILSFIVILQKKCFCRDIYKNPYQGRNMHLTSLIWV